MISIIDSAMPYPYAASPLHLQSKIPHHIRVDGLSTDSELNKINSIDLSFMTMFS